MPLASQPEPTTGVGVAVGSGEPVGVAVGAGVAVGTGVAVGSTSPHEVEVQNHVAAALGVSHVPGLF
ncbi:hypothetical protein CW745_08595 [Psychromonas sp. psych-6C06]|nr:hypothetical protein CW745_08595 [Psychromonas sp. psych-6C06]